MKSSFASGKSAWPVRTSMSLIGTSYSTQRTVVSLFLRNTDCDYPPEKAHGPGNETTVDRTPRWIHRSDPSQNCSGYPRAAHKCRPVPPAYLPGPSEFAYRTASVFQAAHHR